ncbi:MDR family MFS transporter [Mameliella alba]|uniref:MDR family MFS transporter n=1 Tax=Mameliella alba TaxID=561184 RepID=UPI00088AFED8|nr:MDR family MFS transporter [Mameliella alba]MBY6118086.1 MFS transporter [Mameliella alba]OWV41400.1 EmrB/QacA family drug resistance transporter [Mameliella alba]OWV42242.1 EmrB/QacA family drug resistance transporter [Mameliella alba]OWV63972.1 EmrB/QacA family drug resistance transporter [Mameliella alba]PTR38917.1 EmrB/QacA subfamily drug resistance transporter [Mameliella alba]
MSLAETPVTLADDQPDPATLRLALIAIAATLLFASLGQTIVSTAMPIMVADLGGMDHITWVITAYLMASTIGAPVAGKLSDLYGRKIVLQGGILVFVLGAVICGTAGSMEMVIAGRVVQGLGGGGLIVTCMTAVGDLMPPRERGKAQGFLGAAFGVSTVIGPLLGGAIVQSIGWHWIFFVNLPVGVVAFVVLNRALPSPLERSGKPVDYLGAALLAAILGCIVLLPSIAGSYGWSSLPVTWLFIGLALALAGFIRTERRAEEPILPLPLFFNNTFLVTNAVGFLVGMGMFGTITFLPLFLQMVKDISPTASGLFLVPMMGGLILSSTAAGKIMSATGHYKLMPVLSTGLLTLALLGMSRLDAASALWFIGGVMVLVGLGLGPVFAVGVAAVQNAVPRSMMGVGTASTNMFRLIGGSVGTAVFGAMFSAGLMRNLAGEIPGGVSGGIGALGANVVQALPEEAQARVLDGFSDALHPIFWAAAAAALLACLASMLLREEPLGET